MLYLKPRLNYKYTLQDALISIKGLWTKNISSQKLSELFFSDHLFFTNHARTALRIALNSINLPPNANIGVQAFNCFTVFNAIKQAGYNPVFIDINDNFQICLEDLNKKNGSIDALIITHLFGIPADMDKIKTLLKQKPIIEDCAHAFLSNYKNKTVGTFGDIGIFSIGKAKFPSIGSGGYLLINNKDYLENVEEHIKLLKNNTLLSEFESIFNSILLSFLHKPIIYKLLTLPILKKIDKNLDFGNKYKAIEKKILRTNKYLFLNKIFKYNKSKKEQKKNAINLKSLYSEYVTFDEHIFSTDYDPNFFMFPILVKNRDKFIQQHFNNGVEIGTHFSNSIRWAKIFGYQNTNCKNTEKIVNQIITIPTYY
ncbi:MAG TPA: hypothetical protein DCG75_17605 [Bacteroidales bacterium]|nr:hypothetical protein [Bacteroidales bacterium]